MKKKRKKEKPIFNANEKLILQCIGKHRRALTTNEIATETSLSWATVKKYTDKLFDEGIIARKFYKAGKEASHQQKTTKYRLNFKEIYGAETED